jgi:hypothetical protein
MSRIQISLPDAAIDQLRRTAAATGEPTSRVAARLLLAALAGDTPTQPRVAPAPERRRKPSWEKPTPSLTRDGPPWLEPFDDDESCLWQPLMWRSIIAFCRRYPKALAQLPDGWWRDAWRTNIDAASEDPREEFAFHNGLQQLTRFLNQAPGGERRFKPASMPVDWGAARRK